MSRLGNIFYLSVLFGALWGAIWSIIVPLLALFISGLTFQPQVTAGALGGLVAAAALAFHAPRDRTIGIRLIAGFAFIVVLVVASGAQPLGLSLDTYSIGQLIFTVLMAVVVMQSIHLTCANLGPGHEKRYNVEVLCLRFVKGFGLVTFTIAVALPFFVMVMMSLKNQQLLLSNPLDFSIDFGQGFTALFRSYIELFTQYHFGTYLFNSALVSVATVVITLFFAVPGAYAVARLRFPGQNFLSRSILLIYMVPMIVLVIPLYAIFSQLGMRNTLWGLLFVYPATTIPVALYMLQGYFRGIPAELEEAGLMDGLTRLNVIRKITLPLALPALASVALYVFMIAWNEFLFAFMFLDNVDLFTLSRGIAELNSSEVPRQHLMAGAVIATVPVLALFLWFERFLVAGLTAGSVKG
ncbi:carbohydrate ABC transporter permease [Loktanella sp. F6476L]|uniref:carbohydrate ABC transporter permease n=1 Tax=Loktanella sp. F6476L TaxID=2926405 RepID=UPI001FF106C2|nr:carbohydrate ABC transporter permease [Loktanella sp. F6476L]MCK0118983.1 carbohydrate ABC transporter permease [Loktanella sp. F6476L]